MGSTEPENAPENTAENTPVTGISTIKQSYNIAFVGKGSEYFAIMIVNWFLSIITLGLYYPWARAKRLKYVYGQTTLNNEHFHFSGTGKEMFIGFLKLIVFYIVIMGLYIVLIVVAHAPVIALLFLYFAIFAIIPFAVHGSLRYRMSRTSYRSIRFGYRGDRTELIKKFIIGTVLTIITLGIYAAWFRITIRRYTHENIAYGDASFSNTGVGKTLFFMNLKGLIFSMLTLGIYSFWWRRNLFNYYIDTMHLTKGTEAITCTGTTTAGGFFKLAVLNFFTVVLTLGFGAAWADMRTKKFIFDNIKLEGTLSLDSISQTEEEYTNAFGDDAVDFFAIDLA